MGYITWEEYSLSGFIGNNIVEVKEVQGETKKLNRWVSIVAGQNKITVTKTMFNSIVEKYIELDIEMDKNSPFVSKAKRLGGK